MHRAPRLVLRLPAASLLLASGLACAAPDAPAQIPSRICVDLPASPSLDCLNDELRELADQSSAGRQGLPELAGTEAPHAPTAAGLYNQTATRIRMGNSFGQSVFPQRPPRFYTSPLPVMAPPP